jgi:uncharacterized protein YhbP (UPF0306 family)
MNDKSFTKFIKKHHVLTVGTSANGIPWCASCFYAWLDDEKAFVFTTDPATRHGKEFVINSRVAGCVALETRIIGRIRGIQFSGTVSEPSGELADKASTTYIRRFPFAALMDTHLWVITVDHMKLTDNRLGFGKKLLWDREKK